MVAIAGIKDFASIEGGHEPLVNPVKIGEVAEWVQKELDKTCGGLEKNLSRPELRKMLVIISEFTGEGGGVGQGGRGGPGGGLGLGAMLGFETE